MKFVLFAPLILAIIVSPLAAKKNHSRTDLVTNPDNEPTSELARTFQTCIIRLPVKQEQLAMEVIIERIGTTNLDDATSLKESFAAIANDLTNIDSASPRYTPIIDLINNFLDAAVARQLQRVIAQNSGIKAPEVLLAQLLPTIQAANLLFAPHQAIIDEILVINTKSVEAITWFCWHNQEADNLLEITSLTTQIATAQSAIDNIYPMLQNDVEAQCEKTIMQLYSMRNQLNQLNNMLSVYQLLDAQHHELHP